jgi:hypothetical protein
MKERSLALAAIAAVAILVDCGGGGGGSAVAPAPSTGGGTTSIAAPPGTLKATMKITVPAGSATSSNSRRIKMIPSNTQSIVFTLVQSTGTGLAAGSVQGPFGLTASSPGCSSSNAGVTCSLSINAPIGTNIFTASIYSSTNAAAGTQLGSGAVQFSVAQNAANTTSISLNGPIAQIVLASSCPSTNLTTNFSLFANACVLGNFNTFSQQELASSARRPQSIASAAPFLSSIRVYVVATDTSGNLIINPTVYDQPVTLEMVGAPLLSLGVSYASVSLPFTNNAATASTTTDGGLIQLWSPLDTVTVSLVPNQVGPVEGFIFGGIGTVQPVPPPFFFPSPGPSSVPYLLVGGAVAGAPTPSPTPVATASPGPLTWTNDRSNYSPSNGGIVFTTVNRFTNPTQFTADFGMPLPGPSVNPTTFTFGLANNANNAAVGVNYTFSDGGSPDGNYATGCVAGGMIFGLPAGTGSSGIANVSVPIGIDLVATSNAACSITASDGIGNSSYLNISVSSGSITVQGKRRK